MSDPQKEICGHMPDDPDVYKCYVCGFHRKVQCGDSSCEVCNDYIE